MPTPIDAIRPHPRNPRRIAQEALAKLCESIAPAFQVGEGGSTPTTALHSSG